MSRSELPIQSGQAGQPSPSPNLWWSRFLALAQQHTEICWLLTSAGEMCESSSSWQHFTGQDFSQARGRGWLRAVRPVDCPQMEAIVNRVVLSGQTLRCVCHISRADGCSRFIEIQAIPVQTSGRKVRELILCGTDRSGQVESGRMDEAQLQLALQASQVGVWDWDQQTQQVMWTEQCRALFGLPAGMPITHERFLATIHPDDREQVARITAQSLASHMDFHTDYRVIWPDGSLHWLTDRGQAVYDACEQPTHMIGAVIEVTDLKQTEEALAESEARFRRFVESNIIGITIDDLEGQIHEANDAFLSLVGYTRADLEAGRLHWTMLTSPEWRERNPQIIEELRTTGNFTPSETEYISKEGKRVPALIGGTLFRQHDPSSWGICFIVDLSARKAMEQQKDLFLSMTSHELKTPLTALKGTLQMLQRHTKRLSKTAVLQGMEGEAFVQELNRRLAIALRQVDAQTRLINELLDLSRITTDTLELSSQRVDLVRLVRDTVEQVRMTAPERVLELELPTVQSIPVLADEDRLTQVLTNYLTNALRYAPAQEPISIGIMLQEALVQVWVRDRGPGLSEQAQEEVWQRFHRVRSMPLQQTTEKGLGLGLYICQRLMAQHGGQVGVQSTPGQGSTFWFQLPLLQEQA